MLISIKDNFDTRRNIYRLNPIIGWKGKQTNRIKTIKDNPNQTSLWDTSSGEQILDNPSRQFPEQISKKTFKKKNSIET
jgi:hypothetical protein